MNEMVISSDKQAALAKLDDSTALLQTPMAQLVKALRVALAAETPEACAREVKAVLCETITLPEAPTAKTVENPATTYKLDIRDDGAVQFPNLTHDQLMALCTQANSFCADPKNGRSRPAVGKYVLRLLKERNLDTSLASVDGMVAIQGVVPESTYKTIEEKAELINKISGAKWPGLEATVAAAASYYCQTDQNLLKDLWVVVDASGVALRLYSFGLYVYGSYVHRYILVACAAAVPPRNQRT